MIPMANSYTEISELISTNAGPIAINRRTNSAKLFVRHATTTDVTARILPQTVTCAMNVNATIALSKSP